MNLFPRKPDKPPAPDRPACDVCHGSGVNNSCQLWPGRDCQYCNGTGKEPVQDAAREALKSYDPLS